MAHRCRDLLIPQRTQLVNALRAHLAELGLVAARGREGLSTLIGLVEGEQAGALPAGVRAALVPLLRQLESLQEQIDALDKAIHTRHRANAVSRRLETIPGIGVIVATALAATVTDPSAFKSGRDLAAWIGLVPRQNSSGGKERLGHISKQGDRYLRKLLVGGASAVVRHARLHPGKRPWIDQLLARRPACQGRHRGAGQQDRAHRVGSPGARRNLSGTGIGSTAGRGAHGSLRNRRRPISPPNAMQGDDGDDARGSCWKLASGRRADDRKTRVWAGGQVPRWRRSPPWP